MKLAFSTSAVLIGALSLTATAQQVKPKQSLTTNPGAFLGGGDDCAAATPISGIGTFGYNSSAASTGTEGQAESACLFFGSTAIDLDVWYEWTADCDANFTVTTCAGAGNDTKLAVYPGGGCPVDGSSIVCNDDDCGLASTVSFAATNGTSYMIQLGSFPGASGGAGSFDISSDCPATGNADDCAAPTPIAGSGSFPFDSTAATTGLEGQNETNCYKFGSSAVDSDVWFEWTADAVGDAVIDTCLTASGDTKIAIWPAGGCPADGTSIDCNDDTCGLSSQVGASVNPGEVYLIQVGAFPGAAGSTGTVNINITPPSPPANDDCAAAEAIAGQGTFGYDTVFATTGAEGQVEANCYDFGSSAIAADVWYEWTSDFDGNATATLCNGIATNDTKIAAYAGSGCPADGTSLDCNDDTCGLSSQISFDVTNGGVYTIQLGSFPGAAGGTGTFDIGETTIGTSFCVASANSTGGASMMSATGSASIGADDLVLHASSIPASQSGVFYFGANEIAIPFGDGTRCVAGSTWRMPVLFESGSGTLDYDVDMVAFGGLIGAIGTTKFQCWYRDPVGGGAMFNLSDGVSIDMVP